MPVNDDVEDLLEPLIKLRKALHSRPELAYQEIQTAIKVTQELRNIGLQFATGIGGTGIVATLKVGESAKTIGLRADMDALPISENTGLPYASQNAGVAHSCGHDGHTTMLLGTAMHLARTRQFNGTVHFIFQPAEEGQAGAKAMIDSGLFERFPCDRIYSMHNWPELPAGTISTRAGAMMAAADKFDMTITGKGGHAAFPQHSPDAILTAAELITQLNTIVARRIPPTATAVLSITKVNGGIAHNAMPARVEITGTVRTFDSKIQDIMEAEIRKIVTGISIASDTQIEIDYRRYYPATINQQEAADDVLRIAETISDVKQAKEPAFTSADFGFMLQKCPGAYIWLGQGKYDNEPPLHDPAYDFNDDIIATGIKLQCALVENYLN